MVKNGKIMNYFVGIIETERRRRKVSMIEMAKACGMTKSAYSRVVKEGVGMKVECWFYGIAWLGGRFERGLLVIEERVEEYGGVYRIEYSMKGSDFEKKRGVKKF